MIKFSPQIQKNLDDISAVADDLQMKLYVVGGFPRDLVSGVGITDETDLDVTEANGNAFDLAFFVAAKYGLMEPVVYDRSGTALVTMSDGRSVEFHNAFYNVPHIIDQLYNLEIEPTPLNKDVYARDFTINTLLFDPKNGKILDITGKGIHDIENKILRVPISAKKTLARSPANILRGIRFAIQMDLTVDEEYEIEVANFLPVLKQFLTENPESEMVRRTVLKTMKANPQKAMETYKKYGLVEYLPKIPEINDYIKEGLFGITISPVASIKVAQTRMMDHLMKQREKHKSYMRRKKREETQTSKKKFKILERARDGYYTHNPEPEFINKKKIDEKNKILNYVRDKQQASNRNWFKMAEDLSSNDVEDLGEDMEMPTMLNNEKTNEGENINMMDDRQFFINDFIKKMEPVYDGTWGSDYVATEKLLDLLIRNQGTKVYAIETDARETVEEMQSLLFELPMMQQKTISDLQDVEDDFLRNQNIVMQMDTFIDGRENTWQKLSVNPKQQDSSEIQG